MLVSLAVKNFAIVKQLEVSWHAAMTTITGETGAGKSIAIDALAQALGERSDAAAVRADADKAEVIATFDISNLAAAKSWLNDHDLESDDECILRRVISKEGRSKGYINGTPVPAAQLRSLSALLVNIHGQHAHQQLTKPEHQRDLIDDYGANSVLLNQTATAFKLWRQLIKEYTSLKQQQEAFSAQQQLLQYQVNELDEADVQPGEYEEIELEHQRLHHAQSLISDSQSALDILKESESGSAYTALQSTLSILHRAANIDNKLAATIELLESALIQMDEGAHELRSYAESVEMNPERLFEIEQRLNVIMDLARKHQVPPEQLHEHHNQLAQELAQISHSGDRLDELETEIAEAEASYKLVAEKLSQARRQYAKELNRDITASMHVLNMAGAKFEVAINSDLDWANSKGIDKVEFLVSANQGQPLQPLARVASGGELSRISLAIQVIIAQRVTTPTLLFDEVDVGVSGPTASSIGKLMRKLSKNTQVICVTHLPQVACYGHQQHFVKKQQIEGATQTEMLALDTHGRVDELARLLGGDIISDTTRANAQELLKTAQAA